MVIKMYDKSGKFKKKRINDLRAHLCKGKPKELARIPPCEDALYQHVKRVMWMCLIWYNAHIPMPEYGQPKNFGWELKDNILQPAYYTGLSATEKLDSLVCKCTNSCRYRCDYKENKLPCIPSICNCNVQSVRLLFVYCIEMCIRKILF